MLINVFPGLFIAFSIFILVFSINIPHPSEFESISSPWDDPALSHTIKLFTKASPKTMGNSRIINGSPAALGQFPFMILLLIQDFNNQTHGCGGSLIKRNWILTAAHCLRDRSHGFIFAGVTNIMNGTIAWKGLFNQSQMYIHPGFTMEQYWDNDIALIKIRQDIPCNKFVGIIDLPCSCDANYDLDGMQVTTMGFGTVNGNVTDVSLNMNFATLDVIKNCECKKFFPIPIFDQMICTSTNNGMSSCFGDSGSPLTAQILGRTVLVGIVSFGNVKCMTGSEYPAIFTRVSSYMKWIEETMKLN